MLFCNVPWIILWSNPISDLTLFWELDPTRGGSFCEVRGGSGGWLIDCHNVIQFNLNRFDFGYIYIVLGSSCPFVLVFKEIRILSLHVNTGKIDWIMQILLSSLFVSYFYLLLISRPTATCFPLSVKLFRLKFKFYHHYAWLWNFKINSPQKWWFYNINLYQ